jgi:hypothetical protein
VPKHRIEQGDVRSGFPAKPDAQSRQRISLLATNMSIALVIFTSITAKAALSRLIIWPPAA